MIFFKEYRFWGLLWVLNMLHFSVVAKMNYEKINEKNIFNGDNLYEYRLKNGLTVLFVPRHQAKIVTFQVWFAVGSCDEKLDQKLQKTGLAHLFEHMMFRGSEKYPDGKFDEITARMGADKQNATTSYFRTNYYESIPSDHFEDLIELESDRMRNLRINHEAFEKEKGAVVGELRRHMDSPFAVAQDELMKLLYEKTPYRYTVLGSEAEIKGFTLDEANYFYKTFYSPNNATLIVVGDLNEDKLMSKVVKYFGDMKSQVVPRSPEVHEPVSSKERFYEARHPQATSEILLVGYPIPPITSDEYISLSLLATHLSVGMEGRLRKLLIDTGIAVNAGASPGGKPELFEFYVQLVEGNKAEHALKVLDKELQSLQRKKISSEAFDRALNQDLLSLYSEIGDHSSLANFLGEYLSASGNYMRGFEIIDGFKKVSTSDIQKVSQKYFKKERRSVVVMRPEKKVKKS